MRTTSSSSGLQLIEVRPLSTLPTHSNCWNKTKQRITNNQVLALIILTQGSHKLLVWCYVYDGTQLRNGHVSTELYGMSWFYTAQLGTGKFCLYVQCKQQMINSGAEHLLFYDQCTCTWYLSRNKPLYIKNNNNKTKQWDTNYLCNLCVVLKLEFTNGLWRSFTTLLIFPT